MTTNKQPERTARRLNTLPRTDWLPGDVKPVRRGVYERQCRNRPHLFCKFDGVKWYAGQNTPQEAERARLPSIFGDSLPWRGLTQPPKGAN